MTVKKKKQKSVLGWREWVSLPELGIKNIKAKVDTGARTSALHAFDVRVSTINGQRMVQFKIHPLQKDTEYFVECEARVVDERNVTDSGGHTERRLVIETPIEIGDETIPVELTLTDRDTMLFRMLLGRTSIKHHFVVDPAKSYLSRPNIEKQE